MNKWNKSSETDYKLTILMLSITYQLEKINMNSYESIIACAARESNTTDIEYLCHLFIESINLNYIKYKGTLYNKFINSSSYYYILTIEGLKTMNQELNKQ